MSTVRVERTLLTPVLAADPLSSLDEFSTPVTALAWNTRVVIEDRVIRCNECDTVTDELGVDVEVPDVPVIQDERVFQVLVGRDVDDVLRFVIRRIDIVTDDLNLEAAIRLVGVTEGVFDLENDFIALLEPHSPPNS